MDRFTLFQRILSLFPPRLLHYDRYSAFSVWR